VIGAYAAPKRRLGEPRYDRIPRLASGESRNSTLSLVLVFFALLFGASLIGQGFRLDAEFIGYTRLFSSQWNLRATE
jgi:hypothetical protein